MSADKFLGELGQTNTETTTVWCGDCGSWFGASIYLSLDADADPELVKGFMAEGFAAVNTLKCSSCGWTYVARERIAIHYPSKQKIFLLVPENLRHRAQRVRANFIEDVSRSPGAVVPLYVLEPVLVGGHSEFCRIATERETGLNEAPDVSDVPKAEVDRVAPAVVDVVAEAEQAHSRRRTKSLNLLAELLDDDEIEKDIVRQADIKRGSGALPIISDTDYAGEQEQYSRSASTARLSVETTGATLRVLLEEPDGPSVDGSGTDVMALTDIAKDRDESGTESPSAQEPVDTAHELSRGPIADAIEEGIEGSAASLDEAPSASGDESVDAEVEAELPLGLSVRGDTVFLRLADGGSGLVGSLIETGAHVRFRRYEIDGAAALVVLVNAKGSGESPYGVYGFDPDNSEHEHALELLAKSFCISLQVVGGGEVQYEELVSTPLEVNVELAVETAGGRRNTTVLELATSAEFEPQGGMKHNFSEDQFSRLLTAAETQLALSIASYWSTPAQTDLLFYHHSFPAVWWREIVRRCADAAHQFGLYCEPPIRDVMKEIGGHESDASLLHRLLSHFTEVNLNLRSNQLDPLALWENWDRLLAWAFELGIEVDAKIEEIAAQALEAAETFSEEDQELSDESYEAIEISLADAIDIKSLGAFNLRIDGVVGLEDSAADLIQPAMSELADEDLVAALNDSDRRAGASVQLIARNPSEHAAAIFEAILYMTPMELVVVVPSILPVQDVFVPLFRSALSSEKEPPRMAAAMLLAEVGDERAFNPLLEMMLEADEEHWEILAASVARLGSLVVQPALERARVDQVGLSRIAVLLGYVASHEPDCLDGLDRHSVDPAVVACIGQARAVAEKLGRPETPPFAHRLAMLFEAVQQGSVSVSVSEL